MTQDSGRTPDSLDHVDQALVHALQIAPRASWTRIGAILGLDAVTVARRWNRLTGTGAAWISCHPAPVLAASGQGCLAFVEIGCAPGRLLAVARALADAPHVVALSHVTGDRDLQLNVMARDPAMLSRWVTHDLAALDGVLAARTHLAGPVHAEGSRWRLRALGRQQVARLAADAPRRGPAAPAFVLDDLDQRLVTALSVDGRATYRALAEQCDASPDTVRRHVQRLFAADMLHARCEVARPLSEWPVTVTFWGRVPAARLREVTRRVTGMREVRLCASVISRHNLHLVAWVRSLDDAQRFEVRLAERAPDLTVAERAVALWHMKHGGHLLDEEGYRVGATPLALWQEPTAARRP
ncbi:Lrp/AsnC family transcriptional regulator (plasmid) [Streptomyces sp. BHT-5-2]|uniref:Lrp/AsnC family transcriptional regulator n=1 Tax=Streptomyces sp. BHT-5-2 TaxID=2866715 RepID=UPI001C8E4BEB|nr:Lrp/AsnC family transcriptional regulator [Streptomyces sp. BHT-5-2]QZL07753.1 Lrp/AsnC family transcriptional regulator [Streptomyces sp. BHT-5-2]